MPPQHRAMTAMRLVALWKPKLPRVIVRIFGSAIEARVASAVEAPGDVGAAARTRASSTPGGPLDHHDASGDREQARACERRRRRSPARAARATAWARARCRPDRGLRRARRGGREAIREGCHQGQGRREDDQARGGSNQPTPTASRTQASASPSAFGSVCENACDV